MTLAGPSNPSCSEAVTGRRRVQDIPVTGLPSPIALFIPLKPNPLPLPCTADEVAAGDCAECTPAQGEASSGEAEVAGLAVLAELAPKAAGLGQCGEHGQCVHGKCWCAPPYSGARCGFEAACSFFDAGADEWGGSGCSLADPPVADGQLHCLCTAPCQRVAPLHYGRRAVGGSTTPGASEGPGRLNLMCREAARGRT